MNSNFASELSRGSWIAVANQLAQPSLHASALSLQSRA
jgi:hypothetical protein